MFIIAMRLEKLLDLLEEQEDRMQMEKSEGPGLKASNHSFPLRRLDGLHNQPGTGINAQSAIQEEVVEAAIQPIVAEVVECIVSAHVIHSIQQTWKVVFIRMAQLHSRNLLRCWSKHEHMENIRAVA
jgi:hypothetical protein